MKIAVTAALAATLVCVSACATRASGVAPVAVSATDFSSLSCAQARSQLETTRSQVDALSRRQNNAAVADAAGVFFLFLPLGSVFGAGVEGELAQAKGEQIALERTISQRCAN